MRQLKLFPAHLPLHPLLPVHGEHFGRAVDVLPWQPREAGVDVGAVWAVSQLQSAESALSSRGWGLLSLPLLLLFLLHSLSCGIQLPLEELGVHKVLERHPGVCQCKNI